MESVPIPQIRRKITLHVRLQMPERARRTFGHGNGDLRIFLPTFEPVKDPVQGIIIRHAWPVWPSGIEHVLLAILSLNAAATPGVISGIDEDVCGINGQDA